MWSGLGIERSLLCIVSLCSVYRDGGISLRKNVIARNVSCTFKYLTHVISRCCMLYFPFNTRQLYSLGLMTPLPPARLRFTTPPPKTFQNGVRIDCKNATGLRNLELIPSPIHLSPQSHAYVSQAFLHPYDIFTSN